MHGYVGSLESWVIAFVIGTNPKSCLCCVWIASILRGHEDIDNGMELAIVLWTGRDI